MKRAEKIYEKKYLEGYGSCSSIYDFMYGNVI